MGIKNEILFGIVGNIIPRKGQDFFLRSFARAKETKPDLPAKVLIIGHALDQSFDKVVQKIAVQMNLTSHVIFQPYFKAVSDIFAGLDVFVLPAKSEGFSRSILEAMSTGLPILASKISEIEEAVAQGKNGILVDFGDEEGMAYGIIKLTEEKELRKEMGKRNRRRAQQEFDLKSHVKSVERIYKSLVCQS